MAEERMIDGLLRFGFSRDEAEAYLFLLRAGSCPARIVAHKLGINRMKAYRTLKALEERGLVEVIVGRPVKFVAIPLKEALDRHTEELRVKASDLEKSKKEIMEYWKKSYGMVEALVEEPKFRIFQGRQQVYNLLSQICERAKTEILLFTTENDLSRLSFTDIYDKLKGLCRKGVKIRVITQIDQRGLEVVENYMGFAEVHHIAPLRTRTRFVIINGSEAITTFAMDDSMSMTTQRDTGLWTNAYNYVEATKTFFYNLWKATPDAREVVNAIKTGRSPQEIKMIGTQEEHDKTYKAMAESSKEELIIMTERIQSLPINVRDFRAISDRGVKIRLLTQVDLDNLPDIKRIFRSVQVMHNASATNLQLLIVDRREALLHIPLEVMGQTVWSNMKVYIDTMIQVFENYLIDSVPAQEILPKLATQKVLMKGLKVAEKSLKTAGWIVDIPGELIDKSGIKCSFSMVAKRPDLPVRPLVLDLLTEDDALGQIVTLNAKVKEIKPVFQLLASTRAFYNEEVRLADLYGVKLIYAVEAQQLATKIVNEVERNQRSD